MAVASRHFQEIVGPWPLLLSALFYGRTSSSPVGRNGKLSSDCPELALTTDYCYEHHFVCSCGSRLPLSMTPDISRSSSVGSSTQLPLSKKTVEGPMTSDLKNVYMCNLSSGLCGAGYRCGNLGSLHQAQNFILVIKYLKQEGEDGVVTEQRSAPGGGGFNLRGNHICTDLNARKVLKICVRQQHGLCQRVYTAALFVAPQCDPEQTTGDAIQLK